MPWSRSVRDYALKYGAAGGCTVVGVGETKDAEPAALSNATAGHGFEVDDYHAGTGHPGCVAVPTSLAVGEEQDSTGADFLLADDYRLRDHLARYGCGDALDDLRPRFPR